MELLVPLDVDYENAAPFWIHNLQVLYKVKMNILGPFYPIPVYLKWKLCECEEGTCLYGWVWVWLPKI